MLPDGPRLSYGNMTPEKTRQLLAAYAARRPAAGAGPWAASQRRASSRPARSTSIRPARRSSATCPSGPTLDFYRRQKKVILRNCGSIDPLALDEAIARGAYRGAIRAITQMKPEEVIDEMIQSGLRGRGGAAFPTGQKWRLARQADGRPEVRRLQRRRRRARLLHGPHRAGRRSARRSSKECSSAPTPSAPREGFIYVRSEYPLAITTLQHAIAEAEKYGLLGDNIFGSGWSFRVTVRRGAGAYVCGEETALIESIEGHAGEPRIRPPYPVTAGVWGKPTVVNNVKTWASVAPILTRGAAWYAAMGTKRTPGTRSSRWKAR